MARNRTLDHALPTLLLRTRPRPWCAPQGGGGGAAGGALVMACVLCPLTRVPVPLQSAPPPYDPNPQKVRDVHVCSRPYGRMARGRRRAGLEFGRARRSLFLVVPTLLAVRGDRPVPGALIPAWPLLLRRAVWCFAANGAAAAAGSTGLSGALASAPAALTASTHPAAP